MNHQTVIIKGVEYDLTKIRLCSMDYWPRSLKVRFILPKRFFDDPFIEIVFIRAARQFLYRNKLCNHISIDL